MPMVHGGRFTAHWAKPAKLSCLKYTVRPRASAAHTTMTCFERSTPTVVIWVMGVLLHRFRLHAQHVNLGTRCRKSGGGELPYIRCSEPHHHKVLGRGRLGRERTRALARPRAEAPACGR